MRISKKIATAAAALALAVGHWFRLHLIHPHGAPGTGPAGTVPPGQLCRLPEGSDSSLNGISPHR